MRAARERFDPDGRIGGLTSDVMVLGLHTWLWAAALAALAAAGGGSAVCYLLLSELFLHGFCFHPYAGFFLGVHRSEISISTSSRGGEGKGSAGEASCQPTMSTYSVLASLASLNLTHHVEHHDFPGVPWSRLPAVRAAAPEFYDSLYSSPGFCATIYRWLRSKGAWRYACVDLDDAEAEVLQAARRAQVPGPVRVP